MSFLIPRQSVPCLVLGSLSLASAASHGSTPCPEKHLLASCDAKVPHLRTNDMKVGQLLVLVTVQRVVGSLAFMPGLCLLVDSRGLLFQL